MNDWFTVEQIDSSTYVISEYRHWEETHCYLLLGQNKAVLIDTGLGVENIKNITDKLTALPITVITTHVHWDHIGGHKYFDNIAVYEAEKDWLSGGFPLPLQTVKSNLTSKKCDFPKEFCIDDYEIFQGTPNKIFCDGDCFDLGGRMLKVIHTPGHSPGHCCFYEPDKQYLYSGDLIYSGCLDAFYPTTNPQQFFESVKKIRRLNVNRIFPGHHSLNINADIINKIEQAFKELYQNGNLEQGKGIFGFKDFQIHI